MLTKWGYRWLRLDIRADFLARPELFTARLELGSARYGNGPSRAQYSGPLRAKNSAGSARSSLKAREFFFLRIKRKGKEKWADFLACQDGLLAQARVPLSSPSSFSFDRRTR
jgi:hypothetical protein